MLKLTFCLRRKAGMSREEFLAYWKNDHGRRVAGHLAAMGCRRYVQVRALDGRLAAAVAGSRGGPAPFDGVAELWFDDLASFAEHGRADAGRAAAKDLYDDEQTFIDLANSVIFLSEEQLVVEP